MFRFSLPPLIFLLATASLSAATSPNILWITAEDMSPTLGCYGDEYATTPNIDKLASESVRYSHAFATAPVCSPSRSCLITGCYAPSLGTHNMRSAFPIPDSMNGFPALLRDEGWYTTNNVKTDYNTGNNGRIIKHSWDDSSDSAHWRNRPRDQNNQPFFSVFNLMTSHQSRTMVWPYEQFQKQVQSQLSVEEIHDPAEVPVPPYYPETPLIRRELARYYDCVTVMDKQVGEILQQLEDDGLVEETIVFFFSDHGSGMPRHKRALLDSGMHVPLLIRFPKKYQHLAPAKPGETIDRLVSFVDFGPTVLSLANTRPPAEMQGKPFLGPHTDSARESVFGHRDRVDEVTDTARSVRDHRYLYIRNFRPHLSYNQPTAWPDQGEIRHEIYRLTDEDSMTAAQWHFAGPTRPVEELYDCANDPQNLHNLAADHEYAETLARMRNRLRIHLHSTVDAGFVPEPLTWEIINDRPPWIVSRNKLMQTYRSSIVQALRNREIKEELVIRNLRGSSNVGQYWAAINLADRPSLSELAQSSLIQALEDDSASVRIAAAEALGRHGYYHEALPALMAILDDDNLTAVLHAMRTIQMMSSNASSAIPAVRQLLERSEQIRGINTDATFVLSRDQDLAMFINFSAESFLEKVSREEQSEWRSLFDGKTLQGWEARADGDVFVKEGEIQILSKGQNLWLMHEESFADFELQLEVLMPETGYNSGVGFRCVGEKGRPKGYQCEVENQKTGMIYAIGSGWVWPKGDEQSARFKQMAGDSFKVSEWNQLRIRCEGSHIQVWVNGTQAADVNDDRFSAGSIALQHHGKGDVHRFRDIRIRRLGE